MKLLALTCLIFSCNPTFAQTPCGGGKVEDNAKYDWSREDKWLEPFCDIVNKAAGNPATPIKCSIDHQSWDLALKNMTSQPTFKRHFLCMEANCQHSINALFLDTDWPGYGLSQAACKAEIAKTLKSTSCVFDPKQKDWTVKLKDGKLTFVSGTDERSNYNYMDDKLVGELFPCYKKVAKDMGR